MECNDLEVNVQLQPMDRIKLVKLHNLVPCRDVYVYFAVVNMPPRDDLEKKQEPHWKNRNHVAQTSEMCLRVGVLTVILGSVGTVTGAGMMLVTLEV